MTMLACSHTAPQTFNPFWGTNSGVSDDASRLGGLFRTALVKLTESATGNKRFAEVFHSLDEISERCSVENWDGDGAAPVSLEAVEEARALLISLPQYIAMPEVFPEATGSVAFEWYRGKGCRFVITTFGSRIVEFAGLLGAGNAVYGECRLEGGFPKLMREHLDHLYS